MRFTVAVWVRLMAWHKRAWFFVFGDRQAWCLIPNGDLCSCRSCALRVRLLVCVGSVTKGWVCIWSLSFCIFLSFPLLTVVRCCDGVNVIVQNGPPCVLITVVRFSFYALVRLVGVNSLDADQAVKVDNELRLYITGFCVAFDFPFFFFDFFFCLLEIN